MSYFVVYISVLFCSANIGEMYNRGLLLHFKWIWNNHLYINSTNIFDFKSQSVWWKTNFTDPNFLLRTDSFKLLLSHSVFYFVVLWIILYKCFLHIYYSQSYCFSLSSVLSELRMSAFLNKTPCVPLLPVRTAETFLS